MALVSGFVCLLFHLLHDRCDDEFRLAWEWWIVDVDDRSVEGCNDPWCFESHSVVFWNWGVEVLVVCCVALHRLSCRNGKTTIGGG